MKSVTLGILCIAFIAAAVRGISVEDCPLTISRDVYLQVFQEYCYEFVLYRDLEFDTAKDDCRSRGGDLVKIFDRATQDFLYKELRETYGQTDEVWIGLTDKNAEDTWEWMDGSIPDYTNWAPGQPGVIHGLEDCAALDPDDGGRWHDYKCEDLFLFVDAGHRYICQYKSNYRPPQTTTERLQVTDSSPPSTTMTNPSQSTTMTNPPQSTTMTNPPQSTTMTNPPQSTTMTNPPQSTTMTNPPQSTTMTNPPQTTTMTNPPQTTTMTNPPQTTTMTNPPQTTTMTNPTQSTTMTNPPQTTTMTNPPQSTTQPTTQTPQPTTTMPTTPVSTVQADVCPPFVCSLACGLDGYKSDNQGCQLCECDV